MLSGFCCASLSLAKLDAMPKIDLVSAKAADLPCIENLMQFYFYDCSEFLPLNFTDTGLFHQKAGLFWSGVVPSLSNGLFSTHEVIENEYNCTLFKFST